MLGFFNLLAVSTTLTMTKNHSRQHQSIFSPPLPSTHYRCRSHYRCCLESFLRTHPTATAPLPPSFTDVIWHTSNHPLLPLLSSPFLLFIPTFTLLPCFTFPSSSPDSASLHLLFLPVSPSSPPRFASSLSSCPHPTVQTLRFPTCFCPFFILYILFPPSLPQHFSSHPDISPRCFLDRDDLSRGVNESGRRPEAKEVLVVFWLERLCHSHMLTATIKKATHTVTQSCVCMFIP